jgi:DNA-binding NtrC family response regulator
MRIILITAYGNDKVEAEARRLTVYRCLDKPFIIENFLNVVQEALARPQAEV